MGKEIAELQVQSNVIHCRAMVNWLSLLFNDRESCSLGYFQDLYLYVKYLKSNPFAFYKAHLSDERR